ncbi:DUF3631 domain-containing protein [Streptomyces sp. NPDC059474]|uniref:DUF3631 domain-containing protein n=1 Tax=Streptomyces sp. NPDC059474 TaxID=3346846 RepID=UPI00367B3EDE
MTTTSPVDGAGLLDEVEAFHRRFNAFPTPAASVAVALWSAHTHLLDAFESTPRLAFFSPGPGSSTTQGLAICGTLVPQPMMAADTSPAALLRAVAGLDGGRPTILFHEIDALFESKTRGAEELRGLVIAGHRRTGVSYRSEKDGGQQTVQAFPPYAAMAMASLGRLPEAVLTRSVVIRMHRPDPNEHVEAFRARIHKPEGHALRDRLAAWADSVRDRAAGAFPEMPDGVIDPSAELWEPLLAVADVAGGDWPRRAREACTALAPLAARASLSTRPHQTATNTQEEKNAA